VNTVHHPPRSRPTIFLSRLSQSAICIIGWLIAAVAWVVGARFTIDGVIVVTNWLLSFVNAAIVIPTPLGWLVYAALLWIPLGYSRVEWVNNPVAMVRAEGMTLAVAGTICIWLVVIGMDTATTFAGLAALPAPQGSAVGDLLTHPAGLAVVTAFLTLWPEWLGRSLYRRWRAIWR
jgi:hypothetical protein